MPNGTPLTDADAARDDVIKAARSAEDDVTYPDEAIEQLGTTFDKTLGSFLSQQGRLHPAVDLWGGSAFEEFRRFVLDEFIPGIAEAAGQDLAVPKTMTAAALKDAEDDAFADPTLQPRIQAILARCSELANLSVILQCHCPPFFE